MRLALTSMATGDIFSLSVVIFIYRLIYRIVAEY